MRIELIADICGLPKGSELYLKYIGHPNSLNSPWLNHVVWANQSIASSSIVISSSSLSSFPGVLKGCIKWGCWVVTDRGYWLIGGIERGWWERVLRGDDERMIREDDKRWWWERVLREGDESWYWEGMMREGIERVWWENAHGKNVHKIHMDSLRFNLNIWVVAYLETVGREIPRLYAQSAHFLLELQPTIHYDF